MVAGYQKGNEIKAPTEYKETQLSWVIKVKSKRVQPATVLDHIAAWLECLVWTRLSATAAGWTSRRKVANWSYPACGTLVSGEHVSGMEQGLCLTRTGCTQWKHWESQRWSTWAGRPHRESTGVCGEVTQGQRETVFPCIQRRQCRVGWICLQIFFISAFPEGGISSLWKSIVWIFVLL